MPFGAKSVCKMNKILTNMLMKRVFLSLLAIFSVSMAVCAETIEKDYVTYNLVAGNVTENVVSNSETSIVDLIFSNQGTQTTLLITYRPEQKINRNLYYSITPVSYDNPVISLKGWDEVTSDQSKPVGQASYDGKAADWSEIVQLAKKSDGGKYVLTYAEVAAAGVTSVLVNGVSRPLSDLKNKELYCYYKSEYYDDWEDEMIVNYYAIRTITVKTDKIINYTDRSYYVVSTNLPVINNGSVTDLTLPKEVATISAGALAALSNLSTLNAKSCSANISATLLAQVENYSPNTNKYSLGTGDLAGLVFNRAKTELVAILYGNNNKTYYIPESVERVAPDAFVNVKNVTVISTNEDLEFTGTLTNGNKLQKPTNPLQVIKVNDKLGKVVGVVTSKNIKTVANTTYLCLDFSEAEISQSISLDEITGYPLTPNKLFYFGQLKEGITVTGQNVVVNGVCENFVMQDASGAELYIPTRFQAVKATLKRNFSAKDQYATLTVPFELSGSKFRSDFKPAILTKYEDGVVTLTYQGSVPANCPCIVRSKVSGITQLVRENVAVEVTTGANSLSADQGDAVMYGTYAKTEIAVGSGNAYFNTYAAIRRPVGGNYVNAFRAYVYIPDFANVKVEFVGDDEEDVWEVADGVKDVVNNEVTSVEYYSVNGTKLNEMQTGINVVKKTMSDGTVVTSKVVKK